MSRKPFGFDADAHERHHWWRAVLFKLLPGAVIVVLLVWLLGGPVGVAVGVLVALRFVGQALAPDLVALGATTWRGLRALAFAPVQGRFYQFKGHPIRVLDDDVEPQRWIALADLATALGAALPAGAIRRRQPEALREARDGVYVLDAVVLAWLREQRSDRAGRLALWVEREVWYPARGRKASYGPTTRAAEAAPGGDGKPSA